MKKFVVSILASLLCVCVVINLGGCSLFKNVDEAIAPIAEQVKAIE